MNVDNLFAAMDEAQDAHFNDDKAESCDNDYSRRDNFICDPPWVYSL